MNGIPAPGARPGRVRLTLHFNRHPALCKQTAGAGKSSGRPLSDNPVAIMRRSRDRVLCRGAARAAQLPDSVPRPVVVGCHHESGPAGMLRGARCWSLPRGA